MLVSQDARLSPITWGWLKPTILLPATASDWSPNRLRPIVQHELAHIARADWPLLLLADLTASLYWFHPLVWVMRRRIRVESEKACDDSVLRFGTTPGAYAELLLEIARSMVGKAAEFAAGAAAQRRHISHGDLP